MYPTFVVALVYSQRSIEDTYAMGGMSTLEPCSSYTASPEQSVSGTQILTGENVLNDAEKNGDRRSLQEIQEIERTMT